MSLLEKIILDNLNSPFDWYGLTTNPKVSIEFIKNHPELNWKYNVLPQNPNFKDQHIIEFLDKNINIWIVSKLCHPQFIIDHPEINWDLSMVSKNSRLNIHYILTLYQNYDSLSWWYLTIHPNISLQDIFINNHLPWDEFAFCTRPDVNFNHLSFIKNNNITPYIISKFKNTPLDYIEKNNKEILDWDIITLNQNITLDFLVKYKYKSYRKINIYKNKNIPFHDYLKYPKIFKFNELYQYTNIPNNFILENKNKIDFEKLSYNPYLKLTFVYENKQFNWNWKYLSRRNNFSFQFIKNNKDLPFDYKFLTENNVLPFDFIKNNLNKKYNWEFLSKSYIVYPSDIINNFNLPWDIPNIFENPNLNQELLDFLNSKNITISFKNISYNHFNYDNPIAYYLDRQINTHKFNSKIKQELIQVSWNPNRFFNWILDEEEKTYINSSFN